MNKKIYKIISILFILFLCTFIDIKSINALSCEYNMIPPLYYIENNQMYLKSSKASNVTLTYSGDGSKYTITDSYGDFKDSKFDKSVIKSEKCPNYIYVSGSTNRKIKELDNIEEFIKYQRSYSASAGQEKKVFIFTDKSDYPMFLVKQSTEQGSKVISEPSTNAMNSVVSDYNSYLKKYESEIKTNCNVSDITKLVNANHYGKSTTDFLTYVSKDYNSMPSTDKSSKDTNISEKCWNSRYKYVATVNNALNYKNFVSALPIVSQNLSKVSSISTLDNYTDKVQASYSTFIDQANLKNKETTYNSHSKDFCSLYCQLSVCKSGNSSCIIACSSANNACKQAVSKCANIPDSSAQRACYKQNLSDYDNYATARNNVLKQEADEIEELKEKIESEIAQVKKLSLQYISYRLTCEDVQMLHTVWMIMWIVAPSLVVVFGTVDYFRAVIAGDQEKMQKVRKRFPKRVVALIVLILVPSIITIIVNFGTRNVSDSNLMYCVINGGE